ncbi:hypothetical protein [Moorena sp. SIO3H5]|uniref:hypothetical protein n=1 Tax=Moorena sp. SIO3H5 TaxID=2607834 RepID=UPI0013B9BD56|nr:hypothetical protein [Moorena sp. SIO3H5]NEO71897.1 hypothetical protein [Moorena sp. SIO3H5]
MPALLLLALHKFGMILRVLWNGHLGGTGILPVSIYFPQAGYLPHSYLSKDSAMPKKPKAKRVFSDPVPTPYSLLP